MSQCLQIYSKSDPGTDPDIGQGGVPKDRNKKKDDNFKSRITFATAHPARARYFK